MGGFEEVRGVLVAEPLGSAGETGSGFEVGRESVLRCESSGKETTRGEIISSQAGQQQEQQ